MEKTFSEIEIEKRKEFIDKTFYVQWHLTSKCIGDCKFCYMKDSPDYSDELKKELNLKDCLQIVTKISDYLQKNNLSGEVFLTGGDPLLKDGFWEIVHHLRRNNIGVSILGNPHLINEKTAYKLAIAGVKHYQLSIDGLEETHNFFRGKDSFHKTWEKVSILRKYNITVGISYTLSKSNSKDLIKIVSLCRSNGVNVFRPSRLVPVGRGKNFFNDLLDGESYRKILFEIFFELSNSFQEDFSPLFFPACDPLRIVALKEYSGDMPFFLKKHINNIKGCRNRLITILPEGNTHICRRMPISIGRININSIEEIMKNQLVEKIKDKNSFKECSGCTHFNECQGGCPSVTYAMTGDPFKKDPQCWCG